MGFYQTKEHIATCPEFSAVLNRQALSGAWKVALTYTNGRRESFTFASEQVMRRELAARSKHKVRFVKQVSDGRDSGVEVAKRQMLATDPRKSDRVPKPKEPKPSPFGAAFTPEEEQAVIDGCYSAAAQLRATWFNPCQENREIIFRFLADNDLAPTAVNIGNAIDDLYKNNHLIRLQRRRGDSALVPYISPNPADTISEEEVARKMDFKQLQQLVREKQRQAKRRHERPEDRAFGVDFRL
jgi:hypothetical protein